MARGARTGLRARPQRFGRPDRAIAIYDAFGSVIEATADVKRSWAPSRPLVTDAIQNERDPRLFQSDRPSRRWFTWCPCSRTSEPIGAAAVLLDAEYLESSEWDLWRRTAVRIGVLMLLLTGITLDARALVGHPAHGPHGGVDQAAQVRPAGAPPPEADASLFGPSPPRSRAWPARSPARAGRPSEEARLRLVGESLWTEERLKQFVQMRFGERPVFVVSNREPVSHVRDGRHDQRGTAGQRPGDRAGADHARVRRHLGRARQRQRRPRGGRARRPARRRSRATRCAASG